jgi:hypothetical protein
VCVRVCVGVYVCVRVCVGVYVCVWSLWVVCVFFWVNRYFPSELHSLLAPEFAEGMNECV